MCGAGRSLKIALRSGAAARLVLPVGILDPVLDLAAGLDQSAGRKVRGALGVGPLESVLPHEIVGKFGQLRADSSPAKSRIHRTTDELGGDATVGRGITEALEDLEAFLRDLLGHLDHRQERRREAWEHAAAQVQ